MVQLQICAWALCSSLRSARRRATQHALQQHGGSQRADSSLMTCMIYALKTSGGRREKRVVDRIETCFAKTW